LFNIIMRICTENPKSVKKYGNYWQKFITYLFKSWFSIITFPLNSRSLDVL
jgi:hypothetical protein